MERKITEREREREAILSEFSRNEKIHPMKAW